MRASKYRWKDGEVLYLLLIRLSVRFQMEQHQILDGTTSDLNFLTATRSQDRIDVVIKYFCSEVLLLD
jgi:hypothetical protein